jgi:F-type H+-transporting ATPase subunit epsilon
MPGTETFTCTVVTPERVVVDCEAKFVAFPAHDGEIGILPHRAPLVCRLGIGPLRVEGVDESTSLLIDGGFAQMLENRLTILTMQARAPDELDAAAARQALAEALAMKATDEASFAARERALQRARAHLKLAP